MEELGRRGMTNVLVEGGGKLLGALRDADLLDEVHVFVAPSIIGGSGAFSPVGGQGIARIQERLRLEDGEWSCVGGDLYYSGRVARNGG
jgi:diaminohydroxyphosphoribosylaminopyrimidine deaminase/5-amino-6-(5-phosphoribosylamino)uracil reductase